MFESVTDVDEWKHRGIVWGSTFLLTFIALMIFTAVVTNIAFTFNTVSGILLVSLIFSIVIVSAMHGNIHLGIIFAILGLIFMFIGFGALIGHAEYEGVNPITLEFYDKESLWELSDSDINIFTIIAISGVIMFGFGGYQLWNRLLFGWK